MLWARFLTSLAENRSEFQSGYGGISVKHQKNFQTVCIMDSVSMQEKAESVLNKVIEEWA